MNHDRIAAVLRERDEARAEVERLRERVRVLSCGTIPRLGVLLTNARRSAWAWKSLAKEQRAHIRCLRAEVKP